MQTQEISKQNGAEGNIVERTLTPKQLKTIAIIAGAPTIILGCQLAKVSRTRFYKYMDDPLFKSTFRKCQTEIADLALSELRSSVSSACGVLRELLGSENAMIKRLAANDILTTVSKHREAVEVEDRLEKIERVIMERKTYRRDI